MSLFQWHRRLKGYVIQRHRRGSGVSLLGMWKVQVMAVDIDLAKCGRAMELGAFSAAGGLSRRRKGGPREDVRGDDCERTVVAARPVLVIPRRRIEGR